MVTMRPNGAVTPDGGDPPRLTKYFLDLGLTSNRMLTASSQAQADNMVEAMRSTGYPASAQRPLYVFRTDLGGLTAHDGTRWTNLVAQAENQPPLPLIHLIAQRPRAELG